MPIKYESGAAEDIPATQVAVPTSLIRELKVQTTSEKQRNKQAAQVRAFVNERINEASLVQIRGYKEEAGTRIYVDETDAAAEVYRRRLAATKMVSSLQEFADAMNPNFTRNELWPVLGHIWNKFLGQVDDEWEIEKHKSFAHVVRTEGGINLHADGTGRWAEGNNAGKKPGTHVFVGWWAEYIAERMKEDYGSAWKDYMGVELPKKTKRKRKTNAKKETKKEKETN